MSKNMAPKIWTKENVSGLLELEEIEALSLSFSLK